jgi:isocitrate dehydrogenase
MSNEEKRPEKIQLRTDGIVVPDQPIIPFIEGDGIGSDITPAMQKVVDSAVDKVYQGKKKISWKEVLAGERARIECGDCLPEDTLEDLKFYVVGIKGPLTTPVGHGIRSLNVAIRQLLDLYSCVRPVRWYGSASPLRHPEKMDMVIFRENTEDVYAGVEYESDSPQARKLLNLLREMGVAESTITSDAALGIKPIGPSRSKRHVRKALNFALDRGRRQVTFMHKGNIMKFTEGAFMRWGYEVLEEPAFAGRFITEAEIWKSQAGKVEEGKIPVNDRLADNMLQQILTRTDEYDLVITPNLNGDYLSDAAAAGVGGLGMAPGANIGDGLAVFEATHGSAPKYAGQDKVNPSSLILSAAMLLEYLGWQEAASAIHSALETTLQQLKGTYDLVRGWKNQGEADLTELSCSDFASVLVDNLPSATIS